MFIRRMYLVIFMLLGGFVMSTQCSGGSQQEEGMIERPLQVLSLDTLKMMGDKLICSLTVQVPDLCWKVARYDVEDKEGEMMVKIIGEREKEALCAQMIGTLKTRVPLPVQKPGEYTLRFWKAKGVTLDTTLVLPEVKEETHD